MIVALYRTKVQISTPFGELDPEVLHTCLMCPCRACYVCCFFAETVGPLKNPKMSKKY